MHELSSEIELNRRAKLLTDETLNMSVRTTGFKKDASADSRTAPPRSSRDVVIDIS